MLGVHTKPSLYRDFALLSALIIFVLFLASIWVSYKTYQEHSKDILKQLQNETVRIDRSLIIEVERASYLLESLGRQISHYGANNLSGVTQLFKSFDASNYPKNSEFFWVDARQQILVSSEKGVLEKPMDVSDRDYMKKAITSPWMIHIGQPIEGRVSEKWVMPLAIGVTDDENQFLGAVVISLDIASFSKEIANDIKSKSISFAITNTAFTLLTQIAESDDFFQENFSLSKLAKIDITKDKSGVYSVSSLFGPSTIYAYYEKSTHYPYIIFVGYSSSISNDAILGILLPRLLQITVITIFLVSILWTVRKRIIQPVITLTKNTSRIIHGERLDPTANNGPIEIEHLATEIMRISDYIEERRRIEHELAAKNAELMKIRESAEMTNEIKAQFFEQVGNSLVQPATTIAEYADSLKNELFGPLGNAKYGEVADKMYLQANTIIDLLTDIQAISKAESGLLALNENQVELPLMIKKCVRLLHERTRYQSIEVIQDVEDNLPQLLADELRIKQLLLNLLTGAAAQLMPGDIIRLRLNHRREGLMMRIEYVLPDLQDEYGELPSPPSATGKIFSLPVRNNLSEGAASVGIGFALNQLIIAMHDGTLEVRTNAERKVTVTVIFPEKRVVRT